MKNLVFILLILLIFAACSKTEISSARIKSSEPIILNALQKESPMSVHLSSPKKNPKWIAGNYKGLQLGKSTVKDVRRIFGEPKTICHPEDEFDNPVVSQIDYVYENEAQIIFDKKSGIVREVWGGDFSTFKEAVEKYGNDFYETEFTKKGCVFKEYKEKKDREYPFTLAYPQNGFYFYVNDKDEVTAIYYVDKCG